MSFPSKKLIPESQCHREESKIPFSWFLCASVSLWFVVLATIASHAQSVHFRDITAQAGIHFTHNNGAFGKKWLPETMGPGCAFIDYDNDGWPDILLTNGTNRHSLPGRQPALTLEQKALGGELDPISGMCGP